MAGFRCSRATVMAPSSRSHIHFSKLKGVADGLPVRRISYNSRAIVIFHP